MLRPCLVALSTPLPVLKLNPVTKLFAVDTEPNDKFPAPSVCNTCPFEPSEQFSSATAIELLSRLTSTPDALIVVDIALPPEISTTSPDEILSFVPLSACNVQCE